MPTKTAHKRKLIQIPSDFDPGESAAVSAVRFGVSRRTAFKWSRDLMRMGTILEDTK